MKKDLKPFKNRVIYGIYAPYATTAKEFQVPLPALFFVLKPFIYKGFGIFLLEMLQKCCNFQNTLDLNNTGSDVF